jgi:preprotein translocase subunit YajC
MITTILLQAGAPAGGGGMSTLIMIAMMGIVFYFFMIRPQMKKAKTEKQFKETIKKGDKIITIGGIHGKILEVSDGSHYIIEVEGQNRLKIEKSAINVEATKVLNTPVVAASDKAK